MVVLSDKNWCFLVFSPWKCVENRMTQDALVFAWTQTCNVWMFVLLGTSERVFDLLQKKNWHIFNRNCIYLEDTERKLFGTSVIICRNLPNHSWHNIVKPSRFYLQTVPPGPLGPAREKFGPPNLQTDLQPDQRETRTSKRFPTK